MAAQFNYVVAPVTQITHPFTYDIHFDGHDAPGLVTIAGFRNLLEEHIRRLDPVKRCSYTRNRAWLDAIRNGNLEPPVGYAGNQASWKNEIGATNPATSKWKLENNSVYKKGKNPDSDGPETPTEGIYELMTRIHQQHGHKGRDNFFKLVKRQSGSIKKAFCHQFVQVCCGKAESWQPDGSVPYGWEAPVKHREAPIDNRANLDNDGPVDNMNAVRDIEQPIYPQAMPQAIPQNDPVDFEQLDAMMVNNGEYNPNNYYDYAARQDGPPQYPGPQYGAPPYLPAAQYPVAPPYPVVAQYPVAAQHPVADPLYFIDPQLAAEMDDYIQHYPYVFQPYHELAHGQGNNAGEQMPMNGVQMQMQDAPQVDINNYGPMNFAGQEAQAAAYNPGDEPGNLIMFNDGMIADNLEYQPLAMSNADDSMQPMQDEADLPSSHMFDMRDEDMFDWDLYSQST